ncbi:hypothetical protein JOC95_001545 [Bacillus tianshenii]|uniref:DUF4878 domain-containing protein n=1 Tax=Sutcliffiella tianshenii TaxID=1463404 RepID=A0ABS2NZ91_9BACI|nr:hypothetical protein [Bacillus tianshenii]MBM7619693.1 hypothetical protein [Bacillus tianshenii]
MKKVWFVSLLLLVTFLSGCKEDSEFPNSDSPHRTAFMMDFLAASSEGSSKEFEELFAEGIDQEYIQERLDLIKQTQTNGSSVTTMTLVKYENGKALLVQLIYNTDTEEYLIHDVVEVPEDVAAFFEEQFE